MMKKEPGSSRKTPDRPPRKPESVALVTYGCAKNLVDSEVMSGYLHGAGYAMVPDPKRADIILLNTCGFIAPARDEADRGIEAALEVKKRRPGIRVVVSGCYAERCGAELAARFPAVDLWTGVRDFDRIVPLLQGESPAPAGRTFLYDHRSPRIVTTPAGWAYVKISEGCSHGCAFCAIPLIKGPYRSRTVRSIAEEVRGLAERGVREVNLVSQDSTSFGRDRGEKDGLARLLRALARVPGIAWVRVLYGYPEEISDALLEAMADPRVCPYFDVPFQHADPAVLRRMGRSLGGRRGLALIEKIRARVPAAAIRTSLIVGFPGEGKNEFEVLKSFVRAAEFDHLGVFVYSPETGTSAFEWGDPVSRAAKIRRRDGLLEIQAEISASRLKSFVGKTVDVLIEGRSADLPRTWIGRTSGQAPEVDGVVLVRVRRGFLENGIRRVKITGSDVYDLFGTPA
jgi:ribosomal protein S12 methylthiotransferase